MTVEADIFNLLKGMVANRCYPDEAPEGVARPYITYQQVGGRPLVYLERAVPSKKNGRFQISVWADTRSASASLGLQVEAALITATAFQAEAIGAPLATKDEDTGYRGSLQDFSIWSDR